MHYKSGKIFFLNSFFAYLLALFLGTAVFAFWAEQADAAPFIESSKQGDNIRGFAWSSNYGWVSFNSSDFDADGDGKIDASPTANINKYGVNINYVLDTVSGYGWSEHIGWVSFAAGTNVKYNHSTGSFSGRAIVVEINNDIGATAGDLYFNGASVPVSANINQLSADFGRMRGWAWNAWSGASGPAFNGVGIGWLSFSSLNCDSDDNGVIDNSNCGELGETKAKYNVFANLNLYPQVGNSQMWRVSPIPVDQILPGDGGGPNLEVISVGDTAEFKLDRTVDDAGDWAKLIICKNSNPVDISTIDGSGGNTSPSGLGGAADGIACSGPASNTWCRSESAGTLGTLSCQKPMTVSDGIGNNRYYATVCDMYGYCSNPLVSNSFLLNDRPAAGPLTSYGPPNYLLNSGGSVPTVGPGGIPLVTTPPLTAPDPYGHQNDHQMTFRSGWTDTYTNGEMKMFVCGASNFNYTVGSQACIGRTWCTANANPAASPIACVGTLNGTEPAGINNYYVYMCDGYGACSATPAAGTFYVNRRPTVSDGMSAPNWDASQAATNAIGESDLQATLRWGQTDSDGNTLSDAYIRLNKKDNSLVLDGLASNTTGPVAERIGTGVSSICSTAAPNLCSLTIKDRGMNPLTKLERLEWNTSYKWIVRVRDAYAWSEARAYNTSVAGTGVLTDDVVGEHHGDYGLQFNYRSNRDTGFNPNANTIDPDLTFTTMRHNFPIVNHDGAVKTPGITYFPAVPSANEEVKANPNGLCYEDNYPRKIEENNAAKIIAAANPCNETTLDCTYDWDTDAAIAELKLNNTPTWGTQILGSDDQVIMRFKSESRDSAGIPLPHDFVLTVHDRHGYFNSSPNASINYVNEQLPSWQEVK